MDEGKILRLNATQNTPKANAALATAMKTKIQWYVQQGMTVEGKQDFVPLAAASYFLVQLSRHIKAESKLTWREYIMDDADVAKEKLTEEGMEGILAGEPFEYFYEEGNGCVPSHRADWYAHISSSWRTVISRHIWFGKL